MLLQYNLYVFFMIIRNHTTKISGSLTGLPDFLPSTENNWENVWWL